MRPLMQQILDPPAGPETFRCPLPFTFNVSDVRAITLSGHVRAAATHAAAKRDACRPWKSKARWNGQDRRPKISERITRRLSRGIAVEERQRATKCTRNLGFFFGCRIDRARPRTSCIPSLCEINVYTRPHKLLRRPKAVSEKGSEIFRRCERNRYGHTGFRQRR